MFHFFFDVVAFFFDRGKECVIDFFQNGNGAGAGDGVAAEGGAVGAVGDDVFCFVIEEAGADGEAAAEAFGGGDDVGVDVEVHVAVELTGAAVAALYFVDDQEDVVLMGVFVDAFKEIFVQRMHAAFALDGFDHDGADFRMGFAEFDEGIEVIGGGVEEAGGKGEEVLVEDFLSVGGEGGDGAAVEAVDQGDDGGAVFAVFVDGVFAGAFDGTFVGFSAGVGEEYFFHAGFLAEDFCEFGVGLGVEEVGNVVQCVKLFLYGCHPGFVGDAEDVYADAAAKVDVFFAVFVDEGGAFAGYEAYGVTVVCVDYVGLVFFYGVHFGFSFFSLVLPPFLWKGEGPQGGGWFLVVGSQGAFGGGGRWSGEG